MATLLGLSTVYWVVIAVLVVLVIVLLVIRQRQQG